MDGVERLGGTGLGKQDEFERVRHLAEVVRGTQDAVFSKDTEARITSWNPAAERMYGYTAEEAIGRPVAMIVPADHRGEDHVILERIMRGERIETYETERIRKDGARIDVSLTISPIELPGRGIVGASIIARDITAERRRRKAQEFLLAATRGLDASLDPIAAARNIARTAVPELAELCVIDFLRQDGRLGDSVVTAEDPEAAVRLERIRREAPLDPAGDHPVAQVLRAKRPMIWRNLRAPDTVAQVAQNEAHRQLMAEAGYSSAAVVELAARGRTIGAMSFLHMRSDLRYDDADLELLSELADRAALALDNARLYRERDRMAANLQRGLRPPRTVDIPGLEISVVFEAAGEGVEIGGDFYDVFPNEDGCWIVVGDVAGKGIETAGVSVAMRHSVRGLTLELDDPAEVLSRVNELLLEGETLNDFATALVIRLTRREDDWLLRLAGAGHPPAIHLSRDGAALAGGGVLLGAVPEPALGRDERRLEPGDVLLLYTDGWLEAGSRERHRDPEELAELAAPGAGGALNELTGSLRRDAVARGGGSLRDDMVLLAVRPAADSRG
jgi:PAS domain S-box-containing protein